MRLLALLSLSLGLACAAADPADAVKAAEKAWAEATVKGDAAALDKLLANDLTYTHSNGETDTKATFIDNLKTGARRYVRLDHEGTEVRLYGTTAILRATAQVATSAKGAAPSPAHLRFIHVWMLQQGRWRMVAHQSLRLAK